MSFLSDFEGRIGSVFGAAPQGYTEPFSFRKLAKRAAREMENETYEIDGVDTAPALYTVLVSSSDDALMRPLYEQITYEISTLMTAKAQKKNYAFVGSPLVRFMVDPSLKSGKFAVFAENVDSRTLTRLREEERAFLGGSSGVGGAAAQIQRRGPQPHASRAARHEHASLSTPLVTPASVPFSDTDAGLEVTPEDFDEPLPVASASASTPMPVAAASAPVVAGGARPASAPAPQTKRRNVPLVDPRHAARAGAEYDAANMSSRAGAPAPQATCLLIDRQTGRTFTGTAPSTVIGRERSQAQIVLRDPNVSRRHAELCFDGRNWSVTDLNSTNGTLVNDVDVKDCVLRDGDLITVGLVNLEFRGDLQ